MERAIEHALETGGDIQQFVMQAADSVGHFVAPALPLSVSGAGIDAVPVDVAGSREDALAPDEEVGAHLGPGVVVLRWEVEGLVDHRGCHHGR